MDPQKSASKGQQTGENTPPWAPEFFEKLKSEICAEVHARVAFSVRIMLDDLRKEILSQLDNPNVNNESSGCYCKELKKCKVCKEKKHAMKTALQLQRKEEKQILRMNKRRISSESSDSDNETGPVMRSRNFTPPVNQPKLPGKEQNGLSTTSMVDNLNMAKMTIGEETKGAEQGEKIVNCPSSVKDETESLKSAGSDAAGILIAKKDIKQTVSTTEADELLGAVAAVSLSQSSPSDSEFEVVSLPSNINPHYEEGDHEASASELDDTGASGHCSETETETEFKDCKQTAGDPAPDAQGKEPLSSPTLKQKTIAESMVSSTSSAISGESYATLGDSSMAEAGALVEVVTHVPERQRAPYSIAPSAGAEKKSSEEIIHNQPMPSEFLRDRQPYGQGCAEPKPQATPEQPEKPAQPAVDQTKSPNTTPTRPTAPKPTPRSNSAYRVDNLPESLWDEALTVAAQTYNAAKAAVENLADAFVPDVERVLPTPARTGVMPMPPPASVATAQQPQSSAPHLRTHQERQLYDMGFTDTARNAHLLLLYNNDVHRVLQDLIGA